MARTKLTPVTPLGPYIASAGSGALDLTETAADTTNLNAFPITGREILIAHNTDTAAHTITLTTAPDEKGRTDDIATYSIAAGKVSCFNYRGGLNGWQQSDGNAYLQASDPTVKFCVLLLPN
jgi:hypothetical protein